MYPVCPKCQSAAVETRNLARRTGGTIGLIGGAVGGIASALSGAETGTVIGCLAGPVGCMIGTVTGAIAGGLIGGTTGCLTGSRLGQLIDEHILANFRCLDCGHRFNEHGTSPDPEFGPIRFE